MRKQRLYLMQVLIEDEEDEKDEAGLDASFEFHFDMSSNLS